MNFLSGKYFRTVKVSGQFIFEWLVKCHFPSAYVQCFDQIFVFNIKILERGMKNHGQRHINPLGTQRHVQKQINPQ